MSSSSPLVDDRSAKIDSSGLLATFRLARPWTDGGYSNRLLASPSVVFLALLGSGATAVRAADYPVEPVPFHRVKVEDGFWSPRLETNRRTTVGYDFRKCEETGRIRNFAVAGGLETGGFEGIFFNDSDVYKVIEGAAYSLVVAPDPELDAYLERLIAKIAAAQEDDGYLYTARTIGDPTYDYPGRAGGRWSHLAHGHELYNVGHLYEAAVAHWQATGKRSLLDVALRSADLVCSVFGRGEGQRIDVPGHEEIEIGLVKLYRATGEERYLRQAKFFVDMRGRSDLRSVYGAYAQDHVPVVQQDEAVGHAVRAGYLYAGVADVAALMGERAYIDAIDRLWESIVFRKMHLTGGIGATRHGEAFGGDYELPNESAYLETCAAIANALFQERMFLLHGDARYVDVLERIIYNGFLSGVSLSGDRFFYPNPLACDGRSRFNQGEVGRAPWFGCSCCPVNVVRFLPSIPGYVYAVRGDEIFVNLFVGGSGSVMADGGVVELRQETRYPWDGDVRIVVDPGEVARELALRIRVPGWARGEPVPGDLYRYVDSPEANAAAWRIEVEGERIEPRLDRGYAVVRRTWRRGDAIRLRLPLAIRRVVAHERVEADRGRIALERGPIVYCVEGVDNEDSVSDLVLPDDAALEATHRGDLLGGVTVVEGTASRATRTVNGDVQLGPTRLVAIPYAVWAHRGASEMAVWLARDREIARPRPAPTIASRAKISASHCWHLDTTEAVNDQLEPRDSADESIPRFTWWDRRGGTEWIEYEFREPARVSRVEVYWFDDTGHGQCRVPRAWRLLRRHGDEWVPVDAPTEYGTRKDAFNEVRFRPVETTGLRLEVDLALGVSGGILEWRVHE